MSAIGDYVHWSYGGYVERTGRHAGPYYDGAKKAIDNREKVLQKWIERQGQVGKAKDLKDALDLKLQELKELKEKGNGDASNIRDNEIAQKLANDLLEILPKKYIREDMITAIAEGTITGKAYHSAIKNIAGQGTKNQQQAYQAVKTQMENFVNEYSDSIVESLSKISKKKQGIQEVEDFLKNTQQAVTIFLQKVEQLIKGNNTYLQEFASFQQEIQKTYKQLYIEFKKQKTSKKMQNVLEQCATLANALSAGIGSSTHIGELGEAITEIAAQLMVNTVAVSVENLGHELSYRGLNVKNFHSSIKVKDLVKTKKAIGPYLLSASSEKQDLVDVQITLDTGKKMNLSIKTRKPNKTGSYSVDFAIANVLELLQNENKEDFINHFMNLNAIPGLKNNSATININNLVKKLILTKMVAGYNREVVQQKFLAANYFVIIDNVNYISYVVPMSKFLKYIFANTMYSRIPIPSDLTSANKFRKGDDGITLRINTVLKRMAVPSSTTYNISPFMLSKMN